jgi:hypothetical protein
MSGATKVANLRRDFARALRALRGSVCRAVTGGPNTGSALLIDFAPKTVTGRRARKGTSSVPGQAAIRLLIDCTWRLDVHDAVECGSQETLDVRGPLAWGFRSVVNRNVRRVDIGLPAFDLAIHFGSSAVLRVFCDQTDPAEEDLDNYTLFVGDVAFSVGPRSVLTREQAARPTAQRATMTDPRHPGGPARSP